MSNKTKTISYDQRVRFFWILVIVSVLSLLAYFYAVNAITRNVAIRQNLERQIAHTSTNLSALEFAYIKLKNNVTIELAHEHGFREAGSLLYVSRTRPLSLSFNTLNR